MASEDLRLAIVGLGRRSHIFQDEHRPGFGVRIAAVCDLLPERREAARAKFGPGVLATARLEELLADAEVDAVGIFTEDWRHAEPAVQALHAGVPVFVEKPMAITVADCDRMLAAARDTGTPLYVGHNMRHMPVVRLMKQLIDDGAIGEVKAVWCRHFVGYGGDFYFKDWHAERRNVTSLLLQKGAHDIDVIHHLAGARTTRTTALGGLTLYDRITDRHDGGGVKETKRVDAAHWPPLSQRELSPNLDVEDLSHVNLLLDNGVQATYQQCMYTPDYWRNYTVIGTEGRLENFGDGQGAHVKVWNQRTTYNGAGDRRIEVPPAEGTHGGADPAMVREYLQIVRTGARPGISPVQARDAVAAGIAATESLRDGGTPRTVLPVAAELAAHFD
ncbi:oxidoreductase [Mangrovactinospora gilvigrisea]|uniref:Oxidoreductase n=1 Tax=Mangrovactinospora gilvigrisea TaxID=1428644 RepID=A0A1J7BLL4_9ACTN|nr:Gfo/Idh/MocA family oxidoreductase [Mangrovactinospora gilvigrisea]OIV39493.1 oxidoreductase [Mangrovactinospora gilvigrisea]